MERNKFESRRKYEERMLREIAESKTSTTAQKLAALKGLNCLRKEWEDIFRRRTAGRKNRLLGLDRKGKAKDLDLLGRLKENMVITNIQTPEGA